MYRLIKRVLFFDLLIITLTAFAQENNSLSPIEENQRWTLLFNGKDFNGWRQFNGTEMPVNWKIEDEAMKVFLGLGKVPGEVTVEQLADRFVGKVFSNQRSIFELPNFASVSNAFAKKLELKAKRDHDRHHNNPKMNQ